MNVTVLVDFENDSVRTALEVADALGDRLWGVRLDTSEALVDRSLLASSVTSTRPASTSGSSGRCATPSTLRATSACTSSPRVGSPKRRSASSRRSGVPVDAYGVGSSLIRGSNDFTGDIVITDGQAVCEGRPPLPRESAARSCVDATMTRILWDVDTQVDFMEPSGSSTSRVRRRSRRRWSVSSTRRARRGIVHVASADDHELTDPEISDAPDFRNTYPPHCLRGTRGAEKILETKQRDPLPLSLVPFPPGLLPGMIEGRREVLLLKKNFDVFTNPNTEPLLDALDPEEIVVFGVATDVCNDAAIHGFLLRGRRVVLRRGRLPRARRGACGGLHCRLARARSRVLHRRGGDRLPRLRDSVPPADEARRWWGTGSTTPRISPRRGFRSRSSGSSS